MKEVVVPKPKNKNIEGLRAILSLIVLIQHAGLFFGAWFWGAMEMFFVISGYLITNIILENSKSSSNFRSVFLARRFLRIFPLYMAVLVFCFAITAFFIYAGWGKYTIRVWPELVQLFTYTQNIELASSSIPGEMYRGQYLAGFDATWSVVLEEQFYILSALLIPKFLDRTGRPSRGLIIALLAGLVVTVCSRMLGVHWWFFPSRMDGFIFGALIAINLKYPEVFRFIPTAFLGRKFAKIALYSSVIITVSAFVVSYYYPLPRGGMTPWGKGPSLEVFATSLIAFFNALLGFFVVLFLLRANSNRFLASRWLQSISEFSYSTYLWQMPLILCCTFYFNYFHGLGKGYGQLAGGLLTLPVAYYSFKYIEKPYLEYARKYRFNNQSPAT